MPVHWYYDREKMVRDYGRVADFMAPKNPHPDSIFWRSSWTAPSPELDILGDQRAFWGVRGTHYHQNLAAGENTLTVKIAAEIWESLHAREGHDPDDFLRRYIGLLTDPGRHGDTYVEECHRGFFTNLGRGMAPRKCGVTEKHIGGLVLTVPIALYYAEREEEGRASAYEQLALTHAGEKMKVAADAFLSLLYPVLRGEPLEETIRKEVNTQRNPHFRFPIFKWLEEDDGKVVGRHLSTACYVEDAMPAIIYLALKYARHPEEGIVANTNLGGDNVHRGGVLGALLGAENGGSGWPERWVDELKLGALAKTGP